VGSPYKEESMRNNPIPGVLKFSNWEKAKLFYESHTFEVESFFNCLWRNRRARELIRQGKMITIQNGRRKYWTGYVETWYDIFIWEEI
jgi:hypothetical protein